MTTYILGAGASHHAGYPLVSDLWNQLYDWVRGNKPDGDWCRASIEELNQLYGGPANFGQMNFEQILTELDDCPPGSRAATFDKTHLGNVRGSLRYSIPEFFDGIRDGPALLYDQFARERVRAGDVIITFNYDLACERALKTAGKWEIGNGYGFELGITALAPSEVNVLKLHGSTDWSWLNPERPIIRFRKDIEYLGYPVEVSDRSRASASVGEIPAVIMGHKRFYLETSLGGREGEEFWANLWAQGTEAIQSADNIVIIGYSMPTADADARKLLLENSRKDTNISLWCGTMSADLCDEFKTYGFRQVEAGRGGCFEHFLAS